MEKFNKLLELLRGLNLIQTSVDWAESLPKEIWHEYFKGNFKELARNLELDQRRHYETSISVIEIYGKPLGIRHITNLYSETSSCMDIYYRIEFFEMVETTIISYKRVNP